MTMIAQQQQTIERRDHLIQMEMGKRKKRAKKPLTGGEQ